MPTNGANNGRVTNAKLGAMIVAQDKTLARIERKQDRQDERLVRLEVEQGRHDERLKGLRNRFLGIQGVITSLCVAGFAYLKAQFSN